MKLLVIRGDLQSHSGYSAAARDYCRLLQGFFDRVVGVDIHYSSLRVYEPFPYAIVSEGDARRLAAAAQAALVLSFTTPDCFAAYPEAINVGLTFWETDRLPLQGAQRSSWVDQANSMTALWAPSTHVKRVFEGAGVTVPIRVIPWPIRAPAVAEGGLPEGEIYDLDRQAWLADFRIGLARCRELPFRFARWIVRQAGRRAAKQLLWQWRSSSQAIRHPREHALLCVAQDVPRKGLLLLLAEWMEFKRARLAEPWSLILKSTPINPQTSRFDFVSRFWEQVQRLKRQLGINQARVFLWAGDLSEPAFARLLANTHGQIAPSLGEGFCGPAAMALALGKPLIAPRHTAFTDYLAEDHPYCFASRPVSMSFVGDPLRVYDPASTWHVPLPFALADALTRLAADSPGRRAEVSTRAFLHFMNWCNVERVTSLLAQEVQRLLSTRIRPAAA
jgi:glycosyltransferase involved in cell wall biosynthesis